MFYKLFNNEVGACFYFSNNEKDKNFTTTFELQLENLKIVGMDGKNTFSIELAPGKS